MRILSTLVFFAFLLGVAVAEVQMPAVLHMLLTAFVVLELIIAVRTARHHDHLIPNTPRSPRG